MEDVAATGDRGQGQLLPGLQTAAAIADNRLGREAIHLQFRQAHAPGDAVAVLLLAQSGTSRYKPFLMLGSVRRGRGYPDGESSANSISSAVLGDSWNSLVFPAAANQLQLAF